MILVIAQMTTVIITAYTKKTISPKIKGLLDHPLVIMTKNGIAYITRKKISANQQARLTDAFFIRCHSFR